MIPSDQNLLQLLLRAGQLKRHFLSNIATKAQTEALMEWIRLVPKTGISRS